MNSEIHEIVLELDLNCPRERAWTTMVHRISEWWPADFLGLPNSSGVKLEAQAGGRLYETSPEGAHLLWGQVLMIIPGQAIEFAGQISPSFGGPSTSMIQMALMDGEDGKTKFRLANSIVGHFSADGQENVKSGWAYLFGAFKDFCEKE